MKVPARPGAAPSTATNRILFWLRPRKNFFAALPQKRGPASRLASVTKFGPRSALDERAALGFARGFGHHREALALAGIQALAGAGSALAGALALAGIGGHALALRSVGGGGHGRDDCPGQKQRSGGRGERGTRFGIQLHDVLLMECLPLP